MQSTWIINGCGALDDFFSDRLRRKCTVKLSIDGDRLIGYSVFNLFCRGLRLTMHVGKYDEEIKFKSIEIRIV